MLINFLMALEGFLISGKRNYSLGQFVPLEIFYFSTLELSNNE